MFTATTDVDIVKRAILFDIVDLKIAGGVNKLEEVVKARIEAEEQINADSPIQLFMNAYHCSRGQAYKKRDALRGVTSEAKTAERKRKKEEAFRLRFEEGMTYAEVEKQVGVTARTLVRWFQSGPP